MRKKTVCKLFWNALKLSSVLLSFNLLLNNRAWAELKAPYRELAPSTASAVTDQPNNTLEQIDQENRAFSASTSQVTSVSQLSDVQPTDWAFQALQSLVERYGCIAGYPDRTYRGNRSLTRYEFTAGLNACLNRVNELIAAATSDLVRKEDLATLQRLQADFAAELATLRGRVDALEAHTAQLEANQFSTTTKLNGEAIFAVSAFGGNRRAVPSARPRGSNGDIKDNVTFSDRVRLSLNTSFFGQDLLRVRLQSRNVAPFDTAVTGTNMTRLGFDGDESNSTYIDQLFYRFPLGRAGVVQLDAANVELDERGFNTYSPVESSSTGAISRYGRFSPIYRVGNSGLGAGNGILNTSGGAGASLHLNPQGSVGLDLGYFAPNSNQPGKSLGIVNGAYAAIAQLNLKFKLFGQDNTFGFTYARTYDNPGRRNGTISLFDNTGSLLASAPFGNVPTTGNHFGIENTGNITPKIITFGWMGYTQAIAARSPRFSPTVDGTTLAGSRNSKADIWYSAQGVAFLDLFKQGSLAGIIVGQAPQVKYNEAREVAFGNRRRRDRKSSYNFEVFYRYPVTNNIDITPGVLVIFNPENNSSNTAEYVGTLRTTFRF